MKYLFFFFLFLSCLNPNSEPIVSQDEYRNNKVLISKVHTQKDKNKICLIGDSGLNNEKQKKITGLLKNHECKIVFHLGDIIYPKGIKSLGDKKLKTHFLEHYNELDKDIYIILGNHDYYSRNINVWKKVAGNYKNIKFPHFYYAVRINQLCFVLIDSQPFIEGNLMMMNAQKKWLASMKMSLLSCNEKVLLAHHPYKNAIKSQRVSKHLLSFYKKYVIGHFDYLFTGHDHVLAYLGQEKGTKLFISGTAGAFTKKEDQHLFKQNMPYLEFDSGFLEVEIERNKIIKVKAVRLNKSLKII